MKLRLLLSAVLAACIGRAAPATTPARAWQDSIPLPTYAERDADPLPQFSAFFTDEIANYPYPIRSGIDARPQARSMVEWRTLNLENDYLFCRILPDLGGHVYNCRDKVTNKEIFYTNPAIKKDTIGRRGAWIATGIEPNFPVAHSRVTTSPVNFSFRQEIDGAASVIVGDTDRVTGLQWRVEYRLRPDSAVLEEQVSLYNPTSARQPYSWWNDAQIEWDDPDIRFIFPTKLVVSHNSSVLETWPVSSAGVDISVMSHDKDETAWFAYQSREPFMAVYKPKSRSGVAHYADPTVLAGKKMYIFGSKDKADYIRRLTDNFNLYVEMQAGLFTDQETYEFLNPEQARTFTEYWIPFRNLGGVTRVTPSAVLYAARRGQPGAPQTLSVELAATRPIAGAHIRISNGGKAILEDVTDLGPKTVWSKTIDAASSQPYFIQLLDNAGNALLEHTEGVYDASVPPGVKAGPRPKTDWNGPETEQLLVKREVFNELSDQLGSARHDYTVGLQSFPGNLEFEKAAGRVSVSLLRFDDAATHEEKVLAKAPADNEALYFAGVAESRLGNDDKAKGYWSKVMSESDYGAAAAVELALAASRARDFPNALKLLAPLAAEAGRSPRIKGLRTALLRSSGNIPAAQAEFQTARAGSPENALLRHEGVLLGFDDPGLWNYLSGDGERVLNLADQYMNMGLWQDALTLLQHDYSRSRPIVVEPGAVPPQSNALVAYYRAFCETALKKDATEDLRQASSLGSRYVFPNRASSYGVLRSAIGKNPSDAIAHALLGDLELYSFRIEEALGDWQAAVGENDKLEVERQDLVKAAALLGQTVKAPKSPATAAALANNLPGPARSTPNAAPEVPLPKGGSATELANKALLMAAGGKADYALGIFKDPAFTPERQPIAVREAYIEVVLQSLLQLSTIAGKCSQVEKKLFTLGDEDPNVAFTLYGYGRAMATAHFQYYLGVIETNCNNTKEARKYWSKAAKIKPPDASPESSYALLAEARMEAAAARASAEQMLKAPSPRPDGSDDGRRLNHALLLEIAGRSAPALVELSQIARESGDSMVQYLALTELAMPPLPAQH